MPHYHQSPLAFVEPCTIINILTSGLTVLHLLWLSYGLSFHTSAKFLLPSSVTILYFIFLHLHFLFSGYSFGALPFVVLLDLSWTHSVPLLVVLFLFLSPWLGTHTFRFYRAIIYPSNKCHFYAFSLFWATDIVFYNICSILMFFRYHSSLDYQKWIFGKCWNQVSLGWVIQTASEAAVASCSNNSF